MSGRSASPLAMPRMPQIILPRLRLDYDSWPWGPALPLLLSAIRQRFRW